MRGSAIKKIAAEMKRAAKGCGGPYRVRLCYRTSRLARSSDWTLLCAVLGGAANGMPPALVLLLICSASSCDRVDMTKTQDKVGDTNKT